MAKIIKNTLANFLTILLIFLMVIAWIFSGWPQMSGFPPRVQIAEAAQYSRPSADLTIGLWTDNGGGSTNIYLAIDEVTASDTDYIQSKDIKLSQTDTADIRLSSVTDPQSSTGHIVRYRYQADGNAGNPMNLTVELREGDSTTSNLIASQAHSSIPVGWTDGSFTLTTTEADNITNYGNLFLRFVASAGGGGVKRRAQVSWAEFEVPDAPALSITAPGNVQMPDYTLGGTGYSERNFEDVSALVQVTASTGFTVTVSSTALTGTNNTILASDVKLKTDGATSTNPTVITNCSSFSGITETSSGEYALDSAKTIVTTSSGSGTCDIYPTIRVYIDNFNIYVEEDTGVLTFTVTSP